MPRSFSAISADMPTDLSISAATVISFALVLARVAGVFVFVPLPGFASTPGVARIVLSVAFTMALFPSWTALAAVPSTIGQLTAWIAAEATFGIAIGLAVAFALEAFVMGAQFLSVQAGYSYASTIDPTTQADSTVLIVIAQLTGGLLFFALGLDQRVLLAFARSLEAHPPGTLVFTPALGFDLIHLSAGIFTTGFRLVLPMMALLLMLDLSMGLLGRLNAQLQLITLAFPIKTLAMMALFSWAVLVFPRAAGPFLETAFQFVAKMVNP